ncbi:MAG: DUF1698 domain-containing protein [Deltaproteobacteria bacterium]|nr:DUF1698 domain-containing protein [Deltaproteobacteria bacterium]
MAPNPSSAHERAREILRECPEWYHSIELAPGVVTPGRAPLAEWQRKFEALRLPDLHGKSVLDIGAYDGFFSFECEKRGASRVVALDHYVWYTDMSAYMIEWRDSQRTGAPMPPPHASRHWLPDLTPGKRPFDEARSILNSKVECAVDDFMSMDLAALGKFDVVLFLGMLYHMEEPLRAMRRLVSVVAPGGLAVLETEAMEIPGAPDAAYCEFFPDAELNNDASNWWSPNAKAIEGLGYAAGFKRVDLLSGPPLLPPLRELRSRVRRISYRYRAVAHAYA